MSTLNNFFMNLMSMKIERKSQSYNLSSKVIELFGKSPIASSAIKKWLQSELRK